MVSAVPALSCPIRFLCIHRYTPGLRKGGASPCEQRWLGKGGKPRDGSIICDTKARPHYNPFND